MATKNKKKNTTAASTTKDAPVALQANNIATEETSTNSFMYGTHPTKWEDVQICTYAICKDEIKFAETWLSNVWNFGNGSNYICVLDTGSTDGTMEKLIECAKQLEIPEGHFIIKQQVITPWRFDVARNESLKLIPAPDVIDVCYCNDLDEITDENLWVDLRKCVFEHPNFFKIYYQYAWKSDSVSQQPKVLYWYDKIHGVRGWHWHYPVHEVVRCDDSHRDFYDGIYNLSPQTIYLRHYPDPTKSRSNYMDLIKLRADENPDDWYSLFYVAREYTFTQQWENCLVYALKLYTKLQKKDTTEAEEYTKKDTLMLPTICTMIGEVYWSLGMLEDAKYFFKKAIQVCAALREPYVQLAQVLIYEGNYKEAIEIIDNMNKNSKKIADWRVHNWVWADWKLCQLEGDILCYRGYTEKALELFAQGSEAIVSEEDNFEAQRQRFFIDYEAVKKIASSSQNT